MRLRAVARTYKETKMMITLPKSIKIDGRWGKQRKADAVHYNAELTAARSNGIHDCEVFGNRAMSGNLRR